MTGKFEAVATGMIVIAIAVLAVTLAVRSPAALALARVAGIPVPDPPRGSHCACAGGICPLDKNGRRCSCGCALKGDAQSAAAARAVAQRSLFRRHGRALPVP